LGAVRSDTTRADSVTGETGSSGLTPTTTVDKSARIAIRICGTGNLSVRDGNQGSKKSQKEEGFGQHREVGGIFCEKKRRKRMKVGV